MTSVFADNNFHGQRHEGEGGGTSVARKTGAVPEAALDQRVVERTAAIISPVHVPGQLKRSKPKTSVAKATSVERTVPEQSAFKHSRLIGSPSTMDHKGKVSIMPCLGSPEVRNFLLP